jgi:hypothetical protein
MNEIIPRLFSEHGLVASFALVGIVMWISYQISKHLTLGRVHGSAIAIVLGLVLAYLGGVATGGKTGIADIPLFAGVGLMGGAMLRDFAIVATAFEVDVVKQRGGAARRHRLAPCRPHRRGRARWLFRFGLDDHDRRRRDHLSWAGDRPTPGVSSAVMAP